MAPDDPRSTEADDSSARATEPFSLEPLSLEHVRKIARLAMLDPNPAELERARVNLSAVLGYMQRLGAAATTNAPDQAVASSAPPDRLVNALREDIPGGTLTRERFLDIVPQTGGEHGEYLRIPSPPGQGTEGGGA